MDYYLKLAVLVAEGYILDFTETSIRQKSPKRLVDLEVVV